MSEWECKSCTFRNVADASVCAICEGPRNESESSIADATSLLRSSVRARLVNGNYGSTNEDAPLLVPSAGGGGGGDDGDGSDNNDRFGGRVGGGGDGTGGGGAAAAFPDGGPGRAFRIDNVTDNINYSMCLKACCLLFALFIVILPWSLSALEPTEYGLLYNSVTGTVDKENPYSGGRYYIGPMHSFIRFPASATRMEFSNSRSAMAAPIECRTGRDQNDPDSGGQPVSLSVVFYYKLNKGMLGTLYSLFATDYSERLTQFSYMTISNVAQRYNPTQFWSERQIISQAMHVGLQEELAQYGVELVNFQILAIDFLKTFEDTIVDIQLAVQSRTTMEYYQHVVMIMKQIDVLASQTQSIIGQIQANATALTTVMINNATILGFNRTQGEKEQMYSKLTQSLELNKSSFLQYLKMKAMRDHASRNLTIGLKSPV